MQDSEALVESVPEIDQVAPFPAKDSTGVKVNFALIARLCRIGCDLEACAYVTGVTVKDFMIAFRRETDMSFEEFQAYHKEGMIIALRAKQFEKAMAGDSHMLRFLGKHELEQLDEPVLNKKDKHKMNNIPDNILVQIVNQGGKTTVKKTEVTKEKESMGRFLGKETIKDVKQIK